MKLKKARVQNFKSIDDTGEFGIDHVTCLVGKNEAGKSAILEALYKLNPVDAKDGKFEEDEFPRRFVSTYRERKDREPAPAVTTWWDLDAGDVAAVEKLLGKGALTSTSVIVSKGYDNKLRWAVDFDQPKMVADLVSNSSLPAPERTTLAQSKTVDELVTTVSKDTASETEKEFLADLKKRFSDSGSPTQFARALLAGRLPKFVYFAEYQRLPGRIALDDLAARQKGNNLRADDRLFLQLLDLANSSPDDIQKIGTAEKLIMELEAISNRLTDEIFEFWSQNRHLDVQFRCDHARPSDPAPFNSGYVFSTRILNRRHRATVNFEERSTGFIWFFSFLIYFSQVKKIHGDNLFILLDEPGLTLHGKAQKDLLRYMNERLRPKHQVVYSTHSPFMLDVENIFGVRTVEDVVEMQGDREIVHGTKVGERILSRDQDTLLPLQGLLGFDIAQTMFVGPYILVVEGPTEFAYLRWFTRQLVAKGRKGLDIRWAIAPAEGAPKITSFVTLFSGRGIKIAALLDYHEGQKRLVDDLEKSGLLPAAHLLRTTTYAAQTDADIEDLLGPAMFVALVNDVLGTSGTARALSAPAAGVRLAKYADSHAATLPAGFPPFNHYKPAERLLQMSADEIAKLPGLDDALNRFEALFKDINKLIPGPVVANP